VQLVVVQETPDTQGDTESFGQAVVEADLTITILLEPAAQAVQDAAEVGAEEDQQAESAVQAVQDFSKRYSYDKIHHDISSFVFSLFRKRKRKQHVCNGNCYGDC
jgi:hypothetical protein